MVRKQGKLSLKQCGVPGLGLLRPLVCYYVSFHLIFYCSALGFVGHEEHVYRWCESRHPLQLTDRKERGKGCREPWGGKGNGTGPYPTDR